MDSYTIWFNLADSRDDLKLCEALEAYLGRLREEGRIEGYRLQRCKLGFNVRGLGEFMLQIETKNLAQLEEAFQRVVPRADPIEPLHRAVYSLIRDPQFALYRDFPDEARTQPSA